MDQIFIRDLLVRGIIGINDWEREKLQDILINITLFADLRPAGEGDDLDRLLSELGLESSVAADIYRLRIVQMADGRVMAKRNESTWTPALGKEDAR